MFNVWKLLICTFIFNQLYSDLIMIKHLAHAVELHGQRAQMILADQRVDVLLDVADKLLP